MPLSASQHEEVSSLLSVPKDLSGLLSLIPIALFGSEAVRATGSLILPFAGVKRHELRHDFWRQTFRLLRSILTFGQDGMWERAQVW